MTPTQLLTVRSLRLPQVSPRWTTEPQSSVRVSIRRDPLSHDESDAMPTTLTTKSLSNLSYNHRGPSELPHHFENQVLGKEPDDRSSGDDLQQSQPAHVSGEASLQQRRKLDAGAGSYRNEQSHKTTQARARTRLPTPTAMSGCTTSLEWDVGVGRMC